jgi:hypothetical protein
VFPSYILYVFKGPYAFYDICRLLVYMCVDSVLQAISKAHKHHKVKVQSFTRPQLEECGNFYFFFFFCFAELSFISG